MILNFECVPTWLFQISNVGSVALRGAARVIGCAGVVAAWFSWFSWFFDFPMILNFECVPHVALSKFPMLVPWLSGASESHRMRWGSGSVVPVVLVVLVVLRFSNVFEF